MQLALFENIEVGSKVKHIVWGFVMEVLSTDGVLWLCKLNVPGPDGDYRLVCLEKNLILI